MKTTRWTLNAYHDSTFEQAEHLAEVRWFSVSDWGVKERRAVYHEYTAWDAHPWGKGSSGGADFYREWAIERRSDNGHWRGTGRTVGWSRLGLEKMFSTEDAALGEFIRRLDAHRQSASVELGRMNRRWVDAVQRRKELQRRGDRTEDSSDG